MEDCFALGVLCGKKPFFGDDRTLWVSNLLIHGFALGVLCGKKSDRCDMQTFGTFFLIE
jgi:hypothetical protein